MSDPTDDLDLIASGRHSYLIRSPSIEVVFHVLPAALWHRLDGPLGHETLAGFGVRHSNLSGNPVLRAYTMLWDGRKGGGVMLRPLVLVVVDLVEEAKWWHGRFSVPADVQPIQG